jgi:hypothetical protein
LTEAMVNIRATVAEAERRGILSPATAAKLIEIAKALFYKERTYAAVWRAAAEAGLPAAALEEFSAWLPQGRIDRKCLDAEAMLDAIRDHLAAGVPPLRVSYVLAETAAWEAVRRYVIEEGKVSR